MNAADAADAGAAAATRVVVVDDSRFMRTVISDVLEAGGLSVVETASNGARAVAAVQDHEPDVVTMDLEMPEMDGVDAVEEIMSTRPTPVLVLSAHAAEGADRTFEAMERGAVDVFEKPSGEISADLRRERTRLVETVEAVADADVSATTPDGRTDPHPEVAAESDAAYPDDPTLVVGASTGGPPVVEELVGRLPPAAGLRVLVVQHMPAGFTARYADRLDDASGYDVREASERARVGAGEVLVAKGDRHLRVAGDGGGRLRVRLTDGPPVNNVRPALDVTLASAADRVDGPLTAAVLTGMGADGADGVRAVDDAGGTVIAQDEATSAVFGMPGEAIETGAVDAVRPRGELAAAVLEAFES